MSISRNKNKIFLFIRCFRELHAEHGGLQEPSGEMEIALLDRKHGRLKGQGRVGVVRADGAAQLGR